MCAGALLAVLASEARAAEPADLIFRNGFEQPPDCDPDFGTHGTEASALDLGMINDCDTTAVERVGVLGTPGETDYYRFDALDESGCTVDPTMTVVATSAVRACLFFECTEGRTETFVTCPAGSASALSPSGLQGCCQEGASFTLSVEIQCGDASASASDALVFIRLDTAAAACTDYSVRVKY